MLSPLALPHPLHRDFTEEEVWVIWAALWANVRDAHQPLYSLKENHFVLGEQLFEEISQQPRTPTNQELLGSLFHAYHEGDPTVHDCQLADDLTSVFDDVVNSPAYAYRP